MTKLICWLKGHHWRNKEGFHTRGYVSTPYPDSYCNRCHARPKFEDCQYYHNPGFPGEHIALYNKSI